MVRLATVGSVDDGKSTLIGRLLLDSQQLLDDQLSSLRSASDRRGSEDLDLALITDGLRAEREQGITIDVAYRYFATARRKFVLADTPGHVQYTRNMVTGASNAQVAILLLDVTRGVVEQARRHVFIAALLGVPHMLVCVNKMDLVSYSQERFEEIRQVFTEFASRLDIHDLVFVPISALNGDNVAHASPRMSWYGGPTLLYYLETVHVASDHNLIDVRLPIQFVIREQGVAGPQGRWYAGQLAGGVLRVGDRVAVMPAGFESNVTGLAAGSQVSEAYAPMSVRVRLGDDLDVSRGDMIVRAGNRPTVGQEIDVMLCSLGARSLKQGDRFLLFHTTRSCLAEISAIRYRIDVNSLHRDTTATELRPNDVGRVTIHAAQPLYYDMYRRNRVTGGVVLADLADNATVAAGVIRGPTG